MTQPPSSHPASLFSMKPLLILAIFALVLTLLGWRLAGHDASADGKKNMAGIAALQGKKLPEFALPLLEGEGTMQSGYMGKDGPVVLNFFASWCTPCLAELPMLGKLKEKGLPSYGIGWHDKQDATRAWLAKHGSPYLEVASDEKGDTGIAFGLRGIPETFVIGKDGTILYHHSGPISEADIPMLLGKAGVTPK